MICKCDIRDNEQNYTRKIRKKVKKNEKKMKKFHQNGDFDTSAKDLIKFWRHF
jgi:hypothetical protein